MVVECSHPGCGLRFLDRQKARAHACHAHDPWFLKREDSWCFADVPAVDGFVTVGPDGSIGDGSPMRPFHYGVPMLEMHADADAASSSAQQPGTSSQPAASASATELLDFAELQAHAQAELDYDLNLEIKDLLAMSASCGFSASSSPSPLQQATPVR